MSTNDIPQPGGSLLLAWQVKDRHVLLIGGGEVATSRVNLLLQANAKITIVSPELTAQLDKWNEAGLIHKVHRRKYEESDLTQYETTSVEKLPQIPSSEQDYEVMDNIIKNERFALVLTAIPDHELSRVIHYQCKLRQLQCNIADRPKICDFYFGAMHRSGSLQVMISSNGKSPRLTKRIKDEKIAECLKDVDIDAAVENLGYLRGKLRQHVAAGDTNEIIKQRMEWNKTVTDLFSIEKWGTFKEDQLDRMLTYYPNLPPNDI